MFVLVAYVWLTFIFKTSSDLSLQILILYGNSLRVPEDPCCPFSLRTFKTQTPPLQYTITIKYWDPVLNCSIALNTTSWKLWLQGRARFVSVHSRLPGKHLLSSCVKKAGSSRLPSGQVKSSWFHL